MVTVTEPPGVVFEPLPPMAKRPPELAPLPPPPPIDWASMALAPKPCSRDRARIADIDRGADAARRAAAAEREQARDASRAAAAAADRLSENAVGVLTRRCYVARGVDGCGAAIAAGRAAAAAGIEQAEAARTAAAGAAEAVNGDTVGIVATGRDRRAPGGIHFGRASLTGVISAAAAGIEKAAAAAAAAIAALADRRDADITGTRNGDRTAIEARRRRPAIAAGAARAAASRRSSRRCRRCRHCRRYSARECRRSFHWARRP